MTSIVGSVAWKDVEIPAPGFPWRTDRVRLRGEGGPDRGDKLYAVTKNPDGVLLLAAMLGDIRRDGEVWTGSSPNHCWMMLLGNVQRWLEPHDSPRTLSADEALVVSMFVAAELATERDGAEGIDESRVLGRASQRIVEDLRRRHACWHPGVSATPADLEVLLPLWGYTCNEHILAFEESFGGLNFPIDARAGAGWQSDFDVWSVGAGWCVGANVFDATAEGLVPVATGPSDTVFFLDGEGRGWGLDLFGGKPELVAQSVEELFEVFMRFA